MSAGSASVALTFVDTNIWLYAFSDTQDKQKHRAARALVRQTPRIALSTQIINEVSINLVRKLQADEGAVRDLIRSFYRRYLVIELNRSILLHASDLRVAYHFSFWDSLVVASALAAGAATLYSEDMQDGLIVQNQLSIINPLKSLTPLDPSCR